MIFWKYESFSHSSPRRPWRTLPNEQVTSLSYSKWINSTWVRPTHIRDYATYCDMIAEISNTYHLESNKHSPVFEQPQVSRLTIILLEQDKQITLIPSFRSIQSFAINKAKLVDIYSNNKRLLLWLLLLLYHRFGESVNFCCVAEWIQCGIYFDLALFLLC